MLPTQPSVNPPQTDAATTAALLCDRHGRVIEYVRVSITERCDYRCVFCRPAADYHEANAAAVSTRTTASSLTTGETLRLCHLLAGMGVANFKITGGEPFLNPDAVRIIASLKGNPEVGSVTVTTNGNQLALHAKNLRQAGVDCVNVSLNGMTPAGYAALTRCPGARVEDVLAGIAALQAYGVRIKINMVPLYDLNERDIVPLLEFALPRGIPVRFIELMPIGEGIRYRGLSRREVEERVEARFGPLVPLSEKRGNGPAAYARVAGYEAAIGYIAALSQNFCAGCNRIRLTSSGFLKTCLHHHDGGNLAGALREGKDDRELSERIRAIVLDKPERHRLRACPANSAGGGEPMLGDAATRSPVQAMHKIGG